MITRSNIFKFDAMQGEARGKCALFVALFAALFAVLFATALATPYAWADPVDDAEVDYQQYVDSAPAKDGAVECSVTDLTTIGDATINGLAVVIIAEAVGDPVNADDQHTWVSFEQEGSTINVYMTDADAALIQHYGGYSQTGDTLRIVGTYSADCPTHEGDLDIHCTNAIVVNNGSAIVAEVNPVKLYVAGILVAVGVALGVIYWRLRERMR